MKKAELISHYFSPYLKKIDQAIHEAYSSFTPHTQLKEACEYALLSGGKRFRPCLVFMIADAIGKNFDVTASAIAIEFFHTASLVVDDLPSMDNEEMRRNRLTVHKVYGESTALLVSYALIASGYEFISKNAKAISEKTDKADKIAVLALENASFNTGILGATGGQYLDLYPPNFTLETLKEVIHKKTVSLFEIAFVFGWLFGGGDIEKIEVMKRTASHYGMAFQIADDFEDRLQDEQNGSKVNVVHVLGPIKAKELFESEVKSYRNLLVELEIDVPQLNVLADLIEESVLTQG